MPRPVLPGARRYKVVVQQHIAPAGLKGEVNYTYAFIRVATHSARTGRKFRHAEVRDTFWHEVTHGILWEMGHRLYRDEKFVGRFANLLTGAIESARFARREGRSEERLGGGAR